MALHESILTAILTGELPARFGRADLMRRQDPVHPGQFLVAGRSYAKNYLQNGPANWSITVDGGALGDYVKRGCRPVFYRYPHGKYELIADATHRLSLPAAYEPLGDVEGDDEHSETLLAVANERPEPPVEHHEAVLPATAAMRDPAEIVVETLTGRPYQAYFRRQRTWHPAVAARGWEARLRDYFWPAFDRGWTANCARLDSFIVRFKAWEASRDVASPNHAGCLLELFRDICVWGNVKLPETDAVVLAAEVSRALRAIDAGETPSDCRLNSAWTKLYAAARPAHFVIFDSRVATAIVSLLDPHMQRIAESAEFEPYSELGYVHGRGGTRPRRFQWQWPNGYGSWAAQYAANRLCRAIVERLNGWGGSHRWTLREVEAVLFMEGY